MVIPLLTVMLAGQCDARPCGYVSSSSQSPPFGQYQIILLDNKGEFRAKNLPACCRVVSHMESESNRDHRRSQDLKKGKPKMDE